MSALSLQPIASFTAPSLFDAPPSNLIPYLQAAFDKIVNGGFSYQFITASLKRDIRDLGLSVPNERAIYNWLKRVQAKEVTRPSSIERQAADSEQPHAADHFDIEIANATRVSLAKDLSTDAVSSIIWAAHNRFELERLTGKQPIPDPEQDRIVALAIREYLTLEGLDHQVLTTPANRLLDLLMSDADDHLDDKIVDLLTRELQGEICNRLVRFSQTLDLVDRVAS